MTSPAPTKTVRTKRRKSDLDRLESWKAIARYVNRSVRTVRRWEKAEGFPVHRHQHGAGATVYAYTSEVDAWLHRETSVQVVSKSQAADRFANRKLRWAALAAAAVAGFLFAQLYDTYVSGHDSDRQARGDSRATGPSSTPPDPFIIDVSSVRDGRVWSESLARALMLRIITAWTDGQPETAIDLSHSLGRKLAELPDDIRSHLIAQLTRFALATGRLKDARSIVALHYDNRARAELEAEILFASGQSQLLREHLESHAVLASRESSLYMAMAGLTDRALAIQTELGTTSSRGYQSDVVRALASIREGAPEKAIGLLETATSGLEVADGGFYFVALDLLSQLRQSHDHLAEATSLLERTMPQLELAMANDAGLFWMLCQQRLAEWYRAAGRTEDAAAIESTLRRYLQFADDAFPLAAALDKA